MWLASSIGFYSAVQHRDNPDDVLVRARSHADLVNLVDLAERTLISRRLEIVETLDGADYPYRVTMSYDDWKSCLALLVDDIDYDNFKDEVARTNWPRAAAYHDVWFILHRIEREPGAAAGDVPSAVDIEWDNPQTPAHWRDVLRGIGPGRRNGNKRGSRR